MAALFVGDDTDGGDPPSGGGGIGTPVNTGAGPLSATPYPAPRFALSAPGDGEQVLLFDSDGYRKSLAQKDRGTPSWVIDRNGGFTTFSMPYFGPVGTVQAGDRIEVWVDGFLHYRGYVTANNGQSDWPVTDTITGYGRSFDLNHIVANAKYLFPGADGADVADVAQRVFDDWIAPRFSPGGVCWLQTDFAIPVSAAISALDGQNKSLTDLMNELVTLSGNQAVWGCDVDDMGRDRLYLRPLDSLTAATYTVPLPGTTKGKATGGADVSDLVNIVTIDGGTPTAPEGNSLVNASFENPVLPGVNGAGNVILNPSFENGSHQEGVGTGANPGGNADGGTGHGYTDTWMLFGGASTKQNGEDLGAPDAQDGSWKIETDSNGEGFEQTISLPAASAGHLHTLAFYVRPEPSGGSTQARITLYWQLVGGGETVDATVYNLQPSVMAWDMKQFTWARPGAGTNGVRIHVEQVNASSPSEGILWDNFAFFDAQVLYQDNWKTVQFGTGTVTLVDWAYHADRFHGGYAVRVEVNADDTDGEDVHMEPIARIAVTGGLAYRFAGWMKNVPGAVTGGKLLFELHWFKSDGSSTGDPTKIVHDGTAAAPLAAWSYFNAKATAPSDAAFCQPYITFRSDNTWLFDALGFYDARAPWGPDPRFAPYQPDGGLSVRLLASDLFADGGADDVLHDSAATYGVREAIETATDITTLAGAQNLARAYFRSRAVPLYKASVPISGEAERSYWPGGTVRYAGEIGAALAPTPQPIARVRGALDGEGVLARNVETGKEQPTLQSLMLRAALDVATLKLRNK